MVTMGLPQAFFKVRHSEQNWISWENLIRKAQAIDCGKDQPVSGEDFPN